jgi:hypothetical protein
MRSYEVVNNEVQVGYDRSFETRWRHAELVGRVVMLLVVAAAMLGLLGRGPYSHHSMTSPGKGLVVDFEPVARSGTSTQVTLHLYPSSCDRDASVWINGHFVEPFGLSDFAPRPVRSEPRPDGMVLHFPLLKGECRDTMIRLFAKPTGTGPVQLQARLLNDSDRDDGITWTQVVLP